MAAKQSQLTRIFNTIEGQTITVQLKHRESADTPWSDAEVRLEKRFDCSSVPDSLRNGNSDLCPKTYGIWKALSERVSEEDITSKPLAMAEVFDQFVTGLWRAPTVRAATIDITFVDAIAQLKNISLGQAEVALRALDADQRKALRASQKVVDKIAEIKASQGDITTDALADLL